MLELEAIILLLAAVAALATLANRIKIPYPILLVLGGLALGFVPGVPNLELPPDVVLVAVLPPLLYVSAFFTSMARVSCVFVDFATAALAAR